MTPSKKSVGELIGAYERRPILLPEFQRSYSWEKSQVATFWGDLKAFAERYALSPVDSNYFLGPIVVIESKKQILLLDGQQRLATATIFLSVLRDIARETQPLNKDFDYFARDIQRELIEKKDTKPLCYSLSLSDLDEPYFLQAIKTDPTPSVKASLRSHNLISRSRTYFYEEVSKAIVGKTPAKQLDELKSLCDALTKGMSLVAIIVEDEQDANDVFEALNDRGLRLSVPDLVVNLLLKRCTSDKDRKTVRQTWNSMLQQMGPRDVARFLRHLWLSQYGDLKAKGLYTEIKEHLVQNKITSVTFSQACLEACDDYLKLLTVDKSLPKDSRNYVGGLVQSLGVQNCLPLLLSGHRRLSAADFTKLAKEIVTVYVRHTLIGNQNPLEIETAFYDAAREIHAQVASKVSSAKALGLARAKLKALNPADSLVTEKFLELQLSKQEAGWFMVQLANAKQSKTKEIGMDKANVEHIFPQNAGSGWPNRAKLEPLMWHVGNLTILGSKINTKAQNKAFTDKCADHYSGTTGSGLSISHFCLTCDNERPDPTCSLIRMAQNFFIERGAVQTIFATLMMLFFGVGFSNGSGAQSPASRSETIEEYRTELERFVNEVRSKGVVPKYVAQSPAIIFDAKRLIALGDQLLAAPTHRPLGQTFSLLLPIIPLYTPTYDQKTLKRAKEYFAYMEVQTVGLEITGIRGWIDRGKAPPDDPEMTKLVQQNLCERPYAAADFNLNMLASELDSGRLSAEDSAFAAAVVERLRNRKRWYESDAHVSVCKQLDKIVIAPELTARVDENPNRPKPSPSEPPSQAAKELEKMLETDKRIEKQKATEDPFKVAEKQFASQEWNKAEASYFRVINAKRPSAFWEDERIAVAFARLAEIRLIAGKPLEAEKFSRQAIELLDRPESSAYAALAYGLETLAMSLRRTKRQKEADEAEDRVRKLRKLLER